MDIDLLEVIEDEPSAIKNNGGLRVAVYARALSGDWVLMSLNTFKREADADAFRLEIDFNVETKHTKDRQELQ